MQIKNVVFDFGQVMVHFDPAYMVGKYVTDPRDAKLLETVVFDRLYWDRLDAGTITDTELLADCKKRLPERLWKVAEEIYFGWIYNIPAIEGMPELVAKIRDTNAARVFLLSNISAYFVAHAGEMPILRLFETCIFSAACGFVKPSREIFEYLCKTCKILPAETLFVDDNPKNIAGAEAFGIHGYLFDGDVAKLDDFLQNTLSSSFLVPNT